MTFSRRHRIRQTPMTSTMRDSGLVNGTPWKPSMTCGPELPRPRMNRPPDISSMLAALTAMVAAERENTLTMVAASCTRSVLAAT